MNVARLLFLGCVIKFTLGFSPRNYLARRRGTWSQPAEDGLLHVRVMADSQSLSEKTNLRRQGRLNMPKLADKRALGEVIL
jgi:hypothetical protein